MNTSTRYQNGKDGNDHCPWCCDDGIVLVGLNAKGADEYGPCPACMRGYRLEFPEEGRTRWGPQGFWRGVPWNTILTEKSCRCDEPFRRIPKAQMDDFLSVTRRILWHDEPEPEPIGAHSPRQPEKPSPPPPPAVPPPVRRSIEEDEL